jgi:poly(3-hydroxybutyrate) depolymerase
MKGLIMGRNRGYGQGFGLFLGAAALLSLAACSAGDSAMPEDDWEAFSSTSEALTTTYQAESAARSGAIVANANGGYTGTGYVDYQNASNDYIEWTVNVLAEGQYTLDFRYALISGSRPLALRINGAVANASLAFPSTASWTIWKSVTTTVTLKAGSNTVRTTAIGSSGANIDSLKVTNVPIAALDVKKTAGCGLTPTITPGAFVKQTISTSGTKAADCAAKDLMGNPVCGAWSLTRDYYVWLPAGYDKNKAYPIVFEGPGCGGNGTHVYSLENAAGPSVGNTVIRVGLTPPPNSVGHGTNPGIGCFDDKEGDDSVDFVFYERLRDTLKNQFCYDENRVFAAGNSSGSWLANELACKYSGNTAGYAVRGIIANTGGLPTEPQFRPTCTNKPMSGMWVHETGDAENPFSGAKAAINRAMTVNGCSGNNYDTAQFLDYPIGGGNPNNICKQIKGCPTLYPLVVCELPGNGHGSHDNIVNPGGSTYLTKFLNPPFVN